MAGVQAVVGEHQQLRVQRLPTLIGRPQRQIALLLVKGLQARLGGGVYLRREPGANAGELRQGLLYRRRGDQRGRCYG
ncbi:hypothetical protein GCM10008969_51560 [Pseudomonas veronii subsp. inensis]